MCVLLILHRDAIGRIIQTVELWGEAGTPLVIHCEHAAAFV
jgi:hypothetical protein